jgi:hypothetical protein
MEINGKRILLCDCEHTMTLDGKALAKACGADGSPEIASQLCRAQIDTFRGEIAKGGRVLVACTQEAPLFDEVASEAGDGVAALGHVNIRERAGWSESGAKATAKIAALLAEAATDIPPTPTVTMASDGVCLVYGRDEVALEAARQLADRLDVTLLLDRPTEFQPPRVMDVPVFRGTIRMAQGHMGAFEIGVDDYAPAAVSSRGILPDPGPDRRCPDVSRGRACRRLSAPRPRRSGRHTESLVRAGRYGG